MAGYLPPFDITAKMLSVATSITEKIGRLREYHNLEAKPYLRRSNRIRTIQSSLSIEANSLSLAEVRDVIAGRAVYGPENEIQEVRNAFEAYEKIPEIDPYSIDDLKEVHGIMTKGLIRRSGDFRDGEEGVFDGDKVIFVAPPPGQVPSLMADLFDWMKAASKELSPLILSSVFHYEFVFIHPFADGNGRMARLWQTAILSKWREAFLYLPVESWIEKEQSGYYKARAECTSAGNSTIFIEFMLEQIDRTLDEVLEQAKSKDGYVSEYVGRLLCVMEYEVPYTANGIMDKLGLKSKETFRKNYLHPAMEMDLVEMTEPDKPSSRNQRYVKK